MPETAVHVVHKNDLFDQQDSRLLHMSLPGEFKAAEKKSSSGLSKRKSGAVYLDRRYSLLEVPLPAPIGPAAAQSLGLDKLTGERELDGVHAVAPLLAPHPEATWRRWWDALQVVVLLYTGLATPVRVGFGIVCVGGWFWLDLVITLAFIADIVINVAEPPPPGDDEPALERRGRLLRYVRSAWFWVDLLSSIPIEQLVQMTHGRFLATLRTSGYSVLLGQGKTATSMVKLLKVLRLARLVKLLRLTRLSHLLSRYQDRLFLFQPTIALVNQVLIMLFLGHLSGCFFFYFSTASWRSSVENELIRAGDLVTWQQKEHMTEDISVLARSVASVWPDAADPGGPPWEPVIDADSGAPRLHDGHALYCPLYYVLRLHAGIPLCIAQRGLLARYTVSIYWAFTTMSTVGYGDISATTVAERCFAVIAMIIGGFVFSAIIGKMSILIDNLSTVNKAFDDQMNEVELFLRATNLSTDVRLLVLSFFRRQEVKPYELGAILSRLPHTLRGVIARYVLRDVIHAVPFLLHNQEDAAFMVEIASRSRTVRMFAAAEGMPRNVLYEGGTIETMTYVIYKGEAAVVHPLLDAEALRVGPGDICGTDAAVAFLEGSLSYRRKSSVHIVHDCEMLSLPLKDVLQLCSMFPFLEDLICRAYKRELKSLQAVQCASVVTKIQQLQTAAVRVKTHMLKKADQSAWTPLGAVQRSLESATAKGPRQNFRFKFLKDKFGWESTDDLRGALHANRRVNRHVERISTFRSVRGDVDEDDDEDDDEGDDSFGSERIGVPRIGSPIHAAVRETLRPSILKPHLPRSSSRDSCDWEPCRRDAASPAPPPDVDAADGEREPRHNAAALSATCIPEGSVVNGGGAAAWTDSRAGAASGGDASSRRRAPIDAAAAALRHASASEGTARGGWEHTAASAPTRGDASAAAADPGARRHAASFELHPHFSESRNSAAGGRCRVSGAASAAGSERWRPGDGGGAHRVSAFRVAGEDDPPWLDRLTTCLEQHRQLLVVLLEEQIRASTKVEQLSHRLEAQGQATETSVRSAKTETLMAMLHFASDVQKAA